MKTLLTIVAFALASVCFMHSAGATVPSTNMASYLDYGDGPDGGHVGQFPQDQAQFQNKWWATEGQPVRTFHRLTVRDTSGCKIAIGHGTSPTQVVDLYVGGAAGGSVQEVVYPFGLSYGGSATCIWWKQVRPDCTPRSGQQTLNFIY